MSGLTQNPEPTWLRVLRAEVARSTIADVARKMCYGRPTVSLILSGNYNGGTDRFAAKVLETFTNCVHCPFLGEEIEHGTCADLQSRAMPTSDPKALRHWIACRGGCPHSRFTIHGEVENV